MNELQVEQLMQILGALGQDYETLVFRITVIEYVLFAVAASIVLKFCYKWVMGK